MKPAVVKLLSIFLFFIILIAANQSCKKVKEDAKVKNEIQIVKHPLEEQFFAIADSVPDVVKKVAAYIQSGKNKSARAAYIINEVGLPAWEKALIFSNSENLNRVAEQTTTSDTNYVFVPVVQPGTQEVNGVFACKVINDSVRMNFIKEKDYRQYGFNNSHEFNADKLVLLMMYLQNKTFGTTGFVVKDGRLLSDDPYADSTTERLIRFRSISDPITNNIGNRKNQMLSRLIVLQICGETCCNCGELNKGGLNCTVRCNNYVLWVDDPSDDGGGGFTDEGEYYYGNGWTENYMGAVSSSTQWTLHELLGLNNEELNFLNEYPFLSEEIYTYCTSPDGISARAQREVLALSHIAYLMESPAYLNFNINTPHPATIPPNWMHGIDLPWFHTYCLSVPNPLLYVNIQNLKLNAKQAYYLWNNAAINEQIKQFLDANNYNQISQFRARVAINDALAGKPFLLPPVWVDHSTNNNVNRIIVNLLQNKCLEQVFNTITKESYTNKLSEMIRDFDVNENVVVYLVEDNTLGSNVYGQCYLVEEFQGVDYYKISLNPLSLAGASEEKIANTIFHEFIHSYLKHNITKWDFQNNSSHFEILNKYLDKMAETLTGIFGTNIKDAYCLAFSGLFDDETPIEAIMISLLRSKIREKLSQKYNDPIFTTDESIRSVQNQYLKNGTKGRRTINCQ